MEVTQRCLELAASAFRSPVSNVYVTNEVGVIAWSCPERRADRHAARAVGDAIVALSDRRCRCGRGLALMTPVQGRTAHAIVGARGELITGPLVAAAFGQCGAYGWTRRFQLREDEGGTLRLLVQTTRAADPVERRALVEHVQALVGTQYRVALEMTASLPLAPSGKFLYIVPQAQPH